MRKMTNEERKRWDELKKAYIETEEEERHLRAELNSKLRQLGKRREELYREIRKIVPDEVYYRSL